MGVALHNIQARGENYFGAIYERYRWGKGTVIRQQMMNRIRKIRLRLDFRM